MNETLAGIVAKIKLYPAKGVFLAIHAGLTDKPALIVAFNRDTIRKTCQYLVDRGPFCKWPGTLFEPLLLPDLRYIGSLMLPTPIQDE